jgi:hypothetical protein
MEGASRAAGPAGGQRWRLARFWGGWIGAGVGLAFVLNLIWWGLLSPSAQAQGNTETYDIPLGTAAAVAAGAAFPFIPNSLGIPPGGKLVIRNLDTVDHQVGTWTIPPGGSAEISAASGGGNLVCTVHPAGYLGIRIEKRPAITSTILPTILLGAPLGVVTAVATWIGSKISVPDDEEYSPERLTESE